MGLFRRGRRQPSSGEPVESRFGLGELAASLRPFVMAPDRLPPGAAEGAPAVLPGLVTVVAVRTGDQVDFVPPAAMAELGGIRTVLLAAMENVENLDGLQVLREAVVDGRDDTDVVTIWGDDPFVASRVAVLDWLVRHLYQAPAAHGVLVALPTIRRLMLHVVSGAGVLQAAETMALVAEHRFRNAGKDLPISPDVYFVSADQRAQRISHPTPNGVKIYTTDLFGEVLFGPPPRGLGLRSQWTGAMTLRRRNRRPRPRSR